MHARLCNLLFGVRVQYIEDLTPVVISYEMYDTNPGKRAFGEFHISFDMTTSVRFRTSCDCLNDILSP